MKLLLPKIIELEINYSFIYLGIGKNFGLNFNCGWAFFLGIAIKGKIFSVWKFYTGDKWTRLCFALGSYRFAIKI
ncbi:hypothetical protein ES705_09350 [subsurface metagenome]